MTDSDIVTVKEAAAYLKIKMHTLYGLIRKGIIPARRIGAHWRITRDELDTYAGAAPQRTYDVQTVGPGT